MQLLKEAVTRLEREMVRDADADDFYRGVNDGLQIAIDILEGMITAEELQIARDLREAQRRKASVSTYTE